MVVLGNTISNTNLRPTIWQKDLYADAIDNLYFVKNGMMGTGKENIVQIKDDLTKSKGDTIKYGLTVKLQGDGVTGDSELEGNEEKISSFSDSITIDLWRTAVKLDGELDEQRAAYDMRMDAKEKLEIKIQEFLEHQIFFKLGGVQNTGLTDVNGNVIGGRATWANSAPVVAKADELAGTGTRYLASNYDPASGTGGVASLTSANKITPAYISMLKVKAQLASPKIIPLRIGGKNYYVLFIHPWQAFDLKQDPNFKQSMREAEVRGAENPIFTGALGIWDGVVLHEHEYVPILDTATLTANGSNLNFAGDASYSVANPAGGLFVARAMLVGRQAAAFAKCKYSKGWVEKSFDYEDKWGVASGIMGGVQKVTFNSKPYGTICFDSVVTKLV